MTLSQSQIQTSPSLTVINNLTSVCGSVTNHYKLSTFKPKGLSEAIPESIGDRSDLTWIDASNCGLLSSIPESIGKLSNLTSLTFSGCYHLKELPESIGNLSKLVALDLTKCPIKSLPNTITNCSEIA